MNGWWEQTWAFLGDPLMLPLTVTAIAGLIAYLAARRAPALSRVVSLLASLAALVLGIGLFRAAMLPERYAMDYTWLEVGGFRLAVGMSNHTFGALIAMGAGLFGLLVSLYAQVSERGDRGEGRFHAFLCWTLTGAFGAALADNLLWLLICWELVSVCLYMMLNLGKGDYPAGAAKSFGMLGFGDAALLLAIAFIAATQGSLRMSELSIEVGTPLTYISYLLFLVAALAKAGGVPMHSWIPAAASNSPASVFALLPASLDKLLGVYLLVRCSLGFFVLDEAMNVVLMVVGAVTVIAASSMAMMQSEFKKLVAFQAVSSTGYIVLGVGTGSPIAIAGAVFHMLNGATYQACLFLGGGIIERRAGTDDLNRLGGLARSMPATLACSTIAALAIAGVPPLNGFVSKWLVYQGCLQLDTPLAMVCLVAAVFGSALTLAASLKLLGAVFLGPMPVALMGGGRVNGTYVMALPMILLAAACVGFGIFAQWPLETFVLPVITGIGLEQGMQVSFSEVSTGTLGLWGPVPATILILLGLLGGAAFYLIGQVSNVRVTNTFIGGEMLENSPAIKVPATSFYHTIEHMPGVGGALQDGSRGAFDVYRLGGRYGGAFVEVLRRQHTGVLSLYVSWCLVGAVVIIAYLMAVI
jgi:formate hydrogenlyase subunit 3/multisubunit Na+/H+ antiporter MnhD subunit